MLFSFEFITDKLDKTHDLVVSDGQHTYTLTVRARRPRHVFTNIPVLRRPTITLPAAGQFTELSYNEHPYMTEEQRERNRGMLFDGETFYRRTVKGIPKRAVVSFAHFGGHAGFPAPYSLLDASKVGLDDTLYLSFQDPFFVQGSYLLSNNVGQDPKPQIAATIAQEIEAFGISADDVTFFGSSKGAATALIMGQVFPAGRFVLCSLTTDLTQPIRNSRYSHLGQALDFYGVPYPDTAELLFSTAQDREVQWLYSTRDPESTRGNEKRDAPHLVKRPFNLAHGEVVGQNFDLIADIVSGSRVSA